MSAQFENSYALVTGVDENSVARWSLPDVAKDVAATVGVLTHAERCAYPSDNVKLLQGKDATRAGILAGLWWRRERLQAARGGNTTGVVYCSGRGWRDTSTTPDTYYLIPYDLDDSALTATALRAEDFAAAVSALRPRRFLVVLDACRAGGMGVKDLAAADVAGPPPGYAPAALPGARAHVQQGISGAELEWLFAPLVTLVQKQPPDKRGQAEQKVEQLKEEVAKGKAADDSWMGRLIQGLADLVPATVSTVVSVFATPILVGPVTKFVLDGLKGG